MLDELPSLEFAATAVALVLGLRTLVLWRKVGLVRGRTRIESARARDLIGLAILIGALVYAVRVDRASTWFSSAVGVAVVAQLLGFYWRAAASTSPKPDPGNGSEPEVDFEDEELLGCANCGHSTLIELDDGSPLLGGLTVYTPVVASICPSCGALAGHVEDPTKIPVDAAQGTSLREGPSTADHEALEEPREHDG